MTATQPAEPPARERIERRLIAVGRRMQREKGDSFLLRSWPWLCGAVLLAFALDVVWHLEAGPRIALSIAIVLLAVGFAAVAGWIAWGRRHPLEFVARELEAREPSLGTKLLNFLQLHAQTTDPKVAPLTRDLAGQAIERYSWDIAHVDLEKVARTDRVRREATRAGWGIAGFLALLALVFDVTRTETLRFLDPFGDHPPFSFTQLEITDPANDLTQVIYGQGVLIEAKSSGHRPRELWLTYWPVDQPAQTTTVPMFDKGERGFTQQIEAVKSELVVIAHTKNRHSLSRQRHIGVILTPKLDKAWVKLTPPAYTRLPEEERVLQLKSLKALAGTRLDFRMRSNRPLREGSIEIVKSAAEFEHVPLALGDDPMEVSGGFEASETARVRFTLVDRDGHASQETWEVTLQVTHDLPPDVSISNPSADCFASMDFKMEPVIEARDDYGLKTLRIHQAHNGVYGEPRVVEFSESERHAREVVTLDFKNMGLQSGDTVSLFGEAIDTAPEPHIARSAVITITVVSVEDYNAYLRQQNDMADIEAKFNELSNRLQDLVAEQKKLSEQSAALRREAEKAGPEERKALASKLDEMLAQQKEVNNKLNQLADRMDNFVRDQPLYDIEAELKETLADKADQIRESTKKNAMENSILAQHPPQVDPQMPGAFQQSADQQLQRLGETQQQLAKQAMAPLEDMALMHELMKDVNRFQALYDAQKELAQQAKAYDRSTPLTREDQLALKDLAAREKQIGDELDAVQQKLEEDAAAAQEKFPKASKSGATLAQRMAELRLSAHAGSATTAMLQGKGDQSANLSQRLLDEMEKLFSECNSNGSMNDELDSCLKLTHGLNPGSNFKQMMQCQKFGTGNGKTGMGMRGEGGLSGYAITSGSTPPVFGNETKATSGGRTGGQGKDKAEPLANDPHVALDRDDAARNVNAINRESGAVQGEMTVEQYRDLVEKYFKAITK